MMKRIPYIFVLLVAIGFSSSAFAVPNCMDRGYDYLVFIDTNIASKSEIITVLDKLNGAYIKPEFPSMACCGKMMITVAPKSGFTQELVNSELEFIEKLNGIFIECNNVRF